MPLNRQQQLNRAMPANKQAALGDVIAELIAANNSLATKLNAVLAKLDADTGVADTNYAALHGGAAQIVGLESR